MEPQLARQEVALELLNPRRTNGLARILQLVGRCDNDAFALPNERLQYLQSIRPYLTAAEQVCNMISLLGIKNRRINSVGKVHASHIVCNLTGTSL